MVHTPPAREGGCLSSISLHIALPLTAALLHKIPHPLHTPGSTRSNSPTFEKGCQPCPIGFYYANTSCVKQAPAHSSPMTLCQACVHGLAVSTHSLASPRQAVP